MDRLRQYDQGGSRCLRKEFRRLSEGRKQRTPGRTPSPLIKEFRGEWRELSNFGGSLPITAEHLFQAMKSVEWSDQLYVLAASTPGEAKSRGKKVKLREDWEEIKVEVMWCVIQIKFSPGSHYAKLLLSTGDHELIEGNRWGDLFWGAVFDVEGELTGQNELGKLLMDWRDILRQEEK